MNRRQYLWYLVKESFHGTFRVLEIGEAVVALAVHVTGYFAHYFTEDHAAAVELKEKLDVAFVVFLGLLVLTFFVGLFLAAYASSMGTAKNGSKADSQRLRQVRQVILRAANGAPFWRTPSRASKWLRAYQGPAWPNAQGHG